MASTEKAGPDVNELLVKTGFGGAMTTQEFAEAGAKKPKWLVESMIVAGQPLVIGGPRKCLKTSLTIDLVISLATGLPFLGRFTAEKLPFVGLMSGESGAFTLYNTACRVCTSKGLDKLPGNIVWFPRVAKFDHPQFHKGLVATIKKHRLDLLIIDPLYLALGGNGGELNPANMFEVGPLLFNMAEGCLQLDCTPILLHHTTKWKKAGKVLELDDLAFAGIQEFARQWILVNRRTPYQPGEVHELVLNVGGSIGHSQLWDLDIDEGEMTKEFSGRSWNVTVWERDQSEAKKSGKEPNPKRSGNECGDAVNKYAEKVRLAMQQLEPEFPDGRIPRKRIQEVARLSGTNMTAAVNYLQKNEANKIEVITIGKRQGCISAAQYLRFIADGKESMGNTGTGTTGTGGIYPLSRCPGSPHHVG